MTYRQSLCREATLSLVHSVDNIVDHFNDDFKLQRTMASASESEGDTLLLASQQHLLFTPVFPNTLKI